MPRRVRRAPRLLAHVVLAQDAPRGQDQREARPGALFRRHELGDHELASPAHEPIHMHDRRALRCGRIARPLNGAARLQHRVAHAGKTRRHPRDLVHDLARMVVPHWEAQRGGQRRRHFPLRHPRQRLHHLAHPVDAPLRIGEGAVLFQERGTGQEHVRELRRFVQEKVLHHHAFHRPQRRRHVLRVRIGLRDILALDVEPAEPTPDRLVQHVGNAQPGLAIQRPAPGRLEHLPRRVIRHMAIPAELMRKAAHVAGALHVVLPAQRVHPHALAPDIPGRHREVRHAHHHGRTLAVLGHAQPVVDRAIPRRGIQPRRRAQLRRRHPGEALGLLRRILRQRHEPRPGLEIAEVAALAHERLVHQPFRHHHMRHGIHEGHVAARQKLQMMRSLDMRRAHQVDPPRIGHDQLRPLPQPPLHPRGKHRVPIGRVRPDHQDHIRLRNAFEILRPGRGAERRLQPIPRRRVAHPRAGIDVVVAQRPAHQLLHQEHFLVGAARGTDGADRIAPMRRLQPLELRSRMPDRLGPTHLAPRLMDRATDHRLGDPILVRGIAPGEAPLHAGMALVGPALLVRHHPHHPVTLQLRLERTAHAAIGAGGDNGFLRLPHLDHALLGQRRRRAGLHAGAAGNAFAAQEIRRPWRHPAIKTTPGDGQRERPLHLLARAHAAIAHDALGGVVAEIRVALVLHAIEMVGALIAIAHLAQPDGASHVLQLAIPVGRAGQAIQRMVGDVQLHHPTP